MHQPRTILSTTLAAAAARALGLRAETPEEISVSSVHAAASERASEMFLLGGPETPRLCEEIARSLDLDGAEAFHAEVLAGAEADHGVAGRLLWDLAAWHSAAAGYLLSYLEGALTRAEMQTYAAAEQRLRTLLSL